MSAPLSVVIPTLDVAARIGPCLARLVPAVADGLVREVILADGGSADGIAAVADATGARLVTAERGRGTQLAAGCAAARGDWLLVVHADTLLPEGWEGTVRAHLSAHPRAAGYFGLSFDAEGVFPGWVAAWANLRSALCGLPYGDHGLLVPVALYREAGGYPPVPLMEDVELARRIGRRRLRRLEGRVVTSAARYRAEGWLRRGARNLVTLGLWRLGVPPARLARFYRGRR
ncbi:TIGR04283 family arsenosugar biosynthesis glycosyltransferase [Limibaculum sp. M0105]|uniref:TIGR04283 family arsenosugar biosynthesis glycosyltransferase n=1 Tax=Thermohalobaculum xanthum TaxID=2753746 RepID=A0A8J7M940_9RHOB|nr:TIGR04283 family arsenosugar biosynthesis glycosyltransferase [Thermohalobaculum xanthum]MBK0400574.1 TIGR04283 family arsenosugar biosynthesis glycosyltransferase [Thermohalobaculum xanthum]